MDTPTPRRKVQKVQLSKKTVDALSSREVAFDVFDAKVRGFHVRVYPSGTKVFAVRYRDPSGGKKPRYHRHIIGTYGPLTAEQARRDAERVRATIIEDGNPAATKKARRAKATVDDVAAGYLEQLEQERSARWAAEARRLYQREIAPTLGERLVEDIGVEDVEALKHRMRDRKVTANRTRAVLSSILSRAAKIGARPRDVPNAAKFVDPNAEYGRTRTLQPEEWPRVSRALAAMRAEYEGLPAHDTRLAQLEAMLTLALTGARLRSVLPRQWSDLDTAARVLRVVPAHKGVSLIPLGATALAHLLRVRKDRQTLSPYCFPGQLRRVGTRTVRGHGDTRPIQGARSIASLNSMFADLRTRAQLENFTAHDWRRTFGSVGAEVGLNDLQIGGLLGHKVPTVTGKYIHPSLDAVLGCADLVSAEVARRLGLPVDATAQRRDTTSEADTG
jgi:integrase